MYIAHHNTLPFVRITLGNNTSYSVRLMVFTEQTPLGITCIRQDKVKVMSANHH